ncbi:MAG: AsnC family transcriptional regulator [Sporolactobacillus sp.]
MDETDKRIIHYLAENSRMTWRELGKKIHMTGQATRLRVDRLIESGVLRKFTIDVTDEATQFITVYMATRQYRQFEEKMTVQSEIEAFHKISGDGCYLLIAHFSPQTLNTFCSELLAFGRYKISVSLKEFIK